LVYNIMAKELTYQPLTNLGINGLNTQDNPATLDNTWLTKADNVVLRENGRISFRKGLKQNVVPSGTAIGSLIEHNDQGTNKVFASYGTSIYTVDFTTANAAFPTGDVDTMHTVSGSSGDWQFVNFNGRLNAFHEDIVPQRYDGALSDDSMWAAYDNSHRPSSVTSGEFKPSCGVGFYGRMWVGGVAEEKDVVHYSTLLDSDDFRTTAENGASNGGSIDLKNVWGADEVVAIAPFYGQLAVFGKKNIAIYESPAVIGSMKLNEVIRGVGCISRDTIQHIGDDLVFLSSTGLRSLARTTEKDKVPLTDLSLNIKDRLIRDIGNSTNVKSTYIENEGIYLMSFVDKNINYVFDFKHLTPNGGPRVTTWTFDNDREPASLAYTELYGLLVGQQDGGLAIYEEYYDVDLSYPGSVLTETDASYTGGFETVWVNLGESVAASLLKRLFMVLEGGSGATMGLRWYKDFSPNSSTITSIVLNPVTTGSTSLWGASSSLYGATTASHTHVAATHPASSLYKPVYGLKEYRTPLTGSAKNIKIGIDIESNGFDTSLQTLTLLHKQGKIR
jgi:hypothetical protein